MVWVVESRRKRMEAVEAGPWEGLEDAMWRREGERETGSATGKGAGAEIVTETETEIGDIGTETGVETDTGGGGVVAGPGTDTDTDIGGAGAETGGESVRHCHSYHDSPLYPGGPDPSLAHGGRRKTPGSVGRVETLSK